MEFSETLKMIGLSTEEIESILGQVQDETKLKRLLKSDKLLGVPVSSLEKLRVHYNLPVAPLESVELPVAVVAEEVLVQSELPTLMVKVENNSGRKIELSSRVGGVPYAIRILPYQKVELPEELTHDSYYLDLKNNRILIEIR